MSCSKLSDTDTLRDWKWHLLRILPALGLKCYQPNHRNGGGMEKVDPSLGFIQEEMDQAFPSSLLHFPISPKIHMPGGQTGKANEFVKVRIPTGILGTCFHT